MSALGAGVVDWGALGRVVLYSLVAGVAVPAVYALAVLGATRSREERGAVATAYAVLAALGTAACLAAIAYGIWLMTQKG